MQEPFDGRTTRSGRIIERGGHRELLDLGGAYARMWALQQEEEAKELERAKKVRLNRTDRRGRVRDKFFFDRKAPRKRSRWGYE